MSGLKESVANILVPIPQQLQGQGRFCSKGVTNITLCLIGVNGGEDINIIYACMLNMISVPQACHGSGN